MPNGHGFSFPIGFPLVAYPLLALGVTSNRWWSPILALIAVILAAVFTWEAMSRKEFEAIRAKDPTMNLATWRFNWFVFFAMPGYLVGFLGIALSLR